MTDQLSLFPLDDQPAEEKPVRLTEVSALDEMFSVCARFRDRRTYKEILEFISRFPQYSTFNGFLLYVQNPSATHVATTGAWERRYGRTIKSDARPLMILAPMAPVLFLFDIEDTAGQPLSPDQTKPVVVGGRLLQEAFDRTLENCSVHDIAVRETLSSDERAGRVVTLTYNNKKQYRDLIPGTETSYLCVLNKDDSLENRYATLVYGLGHIFCGHLGIDSQAWWQDRRGVDPYPADIEAESVAFLTLGRKGLANQRRRYLSELSEREDILPVFGLNAVFQAVQYIEDMGKSVWTVPKKRSRYI